MELWASLNQVVVFYVLCSAWAWETFRAAEHSLQENSIGAANAGCFQKSDPSQKTAKKNWHLWMLVSLMNKTETGKKNAANSTPNVPTGYLWFHPGTNKHERIQISLKLTQERKWFMIIFRKSGFEWASMSRIILWTLLRTCWVQRKSNWLSPGQICLPLVLMGVLPGCNSEQVQTQSYHL